MTSQLPSNRTFGWVFTGFFAVLGSYSWWKNGTPHPLFFSLSALTALAAIVKPDILAPLNRLWMKFGELLHRIVSPIVLGIIFFGVITPFGRVMALSRRDPLRRKQNPNLSSYWIRREPPGPVPDSFPNQF
jgi:hypothetical protein